MNNLVRNSPLIKALFHEETPYTPIWLMRQAGRYLPEYRAVRKKAGDFLALCKTPELACEVTIQPLLRYRLDAAIIFSDILTIPDAMDLGLSFNEGEGPVFAKPIREANDVEKITVENLNAKLEYVFAAISLTRKEMPADIPLIGFSGSPFTLACYMIEGRGSRDFATAKKMMFSNPDIFSKLIDKLTTAITNYLLAQIKSGANALQIFDTWGGMLATEDYYNFSLAPMKKIVAKIKEKHPEIPLILFTKGGGLWLEEIVNSNANCLGIDWSVPIGKAFSRVDYKCALQGNLDPSVLLAPSEVIVSQVEKLMAEVNQARQTAQKQGAKVAHIFNLGHGITPQVPPENVMTLIEAVHSYKI